MEFSPPVLQRYFSYRYGEDVRVRAVDRFTRGASRQTWFVALERPGGPEEMVLRADLPAGSIEPTSLEQEYFMYERLGRTPVPVAEVLFWEDDPAWTDTAFYARRKVEGSWNVPGFLDPDPRFDELRIALSKEHLGKLALVHQLDWKALGFDERLPAPRDPADCGRAYMEKTMREFDEVRSVGMPVMLEAAEWLLDHAPVAPRICLCKGTNGWGEEIFRGRELVAMSDWEEASIGDPAADFAFLQYLIPEVERDGERLWGLQPALDFYRSISGIEVTPQAIGYYQVIRAMRLIVMGEKGATAVRSDPAGAEVRQTWTATEVSYLCRRGLLAALGASDPPPARALAELHETIEARL